jgi:hypoxanthine-DNA glycosylase
MPELERHAFGTFLPKPTHYLVVGTFPGRQNTQRTPIEIEADKTAFSYGGRNQLWKIMADIYDCPLPHREAKKTLLTQLNIGLADLIAAARRKNQSNADTDLYDIVWNKPQLEVILSENNIKMVYCTGEGVGVIFKKWFPKQAYVVLPSPSPRFAKLSYNEKREIYKKLLPVIECPHYPTL